MGRVPRGAGNDLAKPLTIHLIQGVQDKAKAIPVIVGSFGLRRAGVPSKAQVAVLDGGLIAPGNNLGGKCTANT